MNKALGKHSSENENAFYHAVDINAQIMMFPPESNSPYNHICAHKNYCYALCLNTLGLTWLNLLKSLLPYQANDEDKLLNVFLLSSFFAASSYSTRASAVASCEQKQTSHVCDFQFFLFYIILGTASCIVRRLKWESLTFKRNKTKDSRMGKETSTRFPFRARETSLNECWAMENYEH